MQINCYLENILICLTFLFKGVKLPKKVVRWFWDAMGVAGRGMVSFTNFRRGVGFSLSHDIYNHLVCSVFKLVISLNMINLDLTISHSLLTLPWLAITAQKKTQLQPQFPVSGKEKKRDNLRSKRKLSETEDSILLTLLR